MPSSADRLRALLRQDRLLLLPCCFDALSAMLIERAGFSATFMSGFAVSASRLALPDTGLISFGEMAEQGTFTRLASAVSFAELNGAFGSS